MFCSGYRWLFPRIPRTFRIFLSVVCYNLSASDYPPLALCSHRRGDKTDAESNSVWLTSPSHKFVVGFGVKWSDLQSPNIFTYFSEFCRFKFSFFYTSFRFQGWQMMHTTSFSYPTLRYSVWTNKLRLLSDAITISFFPRLEGYIILLKFDCKWGGYNAFVRVTFVATEM